ncbi:MAG: hypothetical protein RL272_817 [Candidatus Parcubacteria bacterium]|jgi:hypothetical protein
MTRTRDASNYGVFLLCAVSAIAAGCSRCGSEHLRQVEECQVAANHERPEICNGKDDNCNCAADTNGDGIVCGPGDQGVDEGCDDDGDGYCDSAVMSDPGTATCIASPPDCDDLDPAVHPGAPEICDGKDNDCNGKKELADPTFSDPGVGQACNDGTLPPQLAGIGSCALGKTACAADGTIRCMGTVGPRTETCNGKDDDCNGQTDEGPASFELCWSPANPLIGECHPGFHLCRNGKFDTSTCVNEGLPQPEICDGKDQNCNGVVDDGARDNTPVYVLFHLDCSGSMLDKISAIQTFLSDLDTLPAVYRSSQVKFGLVLYPDAAGQLPWVHQTYADVAAFRASLASIDTSACGWLEPNVDSAAFGLCSSRPTSEWPASHLCRALYDHEWNRCGGAGGNPAASAAGTICRTVLTGGYLTSRIYDLAVPDGANQLHVVMSDEEAQTNNALTGASVDGIRADLRAKYAAAGWTGQIKIACFLNGSVASTFSPMCDKTYSISSATTSGQMMTDFTNELQDIYCH